MLVVLALFVVPLPFGVVSFAAMPVVAFSVMSTARAALAPAFTGRTVMARVMFVVSGAARGQSEGAERAEGES